MKIINYLLLVFIVVLVNISRARVPDGKYSDSIGNFISLKNGYMEFELGNFVGGGKYKSTNKKFIIEIDDSYITNLNSHYEFIPQEQYKKGEYLFLINQNEEKFLYGFFINYHNNETYFHKPDSRHVPVFKYKSIYIDSSGIKHVTIPEIPNDSILRITRDNCEPLKIKLKNFDGGTFNVFMEKGMRDYYEMYFIKDKNFKIKYHFTDNELNIEYTLIYHSGDKVVNKKTLTRIE